MTDENGQKRRQGRPSHQPTVQSRADVLALAQYGATRTVIAHSLNIHKDTLKKHYEAELERGEALGNIEIKKSLFQLATQDRDVRALIHLDKTRCGAVEAGRYEISTSENAPFTGWLIERAEKPDSSDAD